MITDDQIQRLIRIPKVIIDKRPVVGYREEHGSRRCDLSLQSSNKPDEAFLIFIRCHIRFQQNFSIGLRHTINVDRPMPLTLVRYNGPHGETSRAPDGHYAVPHIHYVTADEIAAGHIQPQETRREFTKKYTNFDEALREFFAETAVENPKHYFPELWKPRLFNGH